MQESREKYDLILINSQFKQKGKSFVQNIPVNLLELGSYIVSKGYKVKIIDCVVHEDSLSIIKKYANSSGLFGFGVMTQQIGESLRLTKLVRSLNPKAKIIWGGIHPSLFPEQTIKCEHIDYVIMGEGELPLHALMQVLDANEGVSKSPKSSTSAKSKKISLKEVPSLVYKDKSGLITTNPFPKPIDVNLLPHIEWNLLEPKVLKAYKDEVDKHYPLPISSSRGCPHRCTFCINTCVNGYNKWRGKDPDKVIEAFDHIRYVLKTKRIKMRDECFFVRRERTLEILKRMKEKKYGFQWEANCRVDYFTKGVVDDEILKLMKETGCFKINFGVESGNPKILKMMRKDIRLEDALFAAKQLKKYKIESSYSFMCGIPYETKPQMIQTIRFMKKLKSINPEHILLFGPQPYRPYPGGQMYTDALTLGWKEPKRLEDWDKLNSELDISFTSKLFPWVKDNNFVDNIWMYSTMATNTWSRHFKVQGIKAPKIFLLAFALVCKTRWALGIYDHFFEAEIISLYYKMVKKMESKKQVDQPDLS